MITTVAAFKGGVGKTTTAVHLAAICQQRGPTLLIDGDPNRSATTWHSRGTGFPFAVMEPERGSAEVRRGSFEHVVIDTQARTEKEALVELAGSCDLLVVPTTPDVLAIDALMQTAEVLESVGGRYRILLTMVPPNSRAGQDVTVELRNAGWPVFESYVRRLAAFQRAVLAGCLVGDTSDARAAEGWKDYRAVGKELFSGETISKRTRKRN